MVVDYIKYICEKRMWMPMNESLKKVYMKSAEQILLENDISLEPPIDIDKLVKNMGIAVREQEFESVEEATGLPKDSILGATLSLDNYLLLMYKKYENKRNDHGKRFTLAHELAHCALHAEELEINHLELRSDVCNKDDPREVAANVFAGELLIPENSLRKICNRFLIPSLSALTEIFDVSAGVMKKRLEELGIQYFNDIKKDEIRVE